MLEVFLDGIRASDDFKCVIKMQQYSVPTGSRIVPECEGYQEKQKVLPYNELETGREWNHDKGGEFGRSGDS